MSDRLNTLQNWLKDYSTTPYTLAPITNDASFRRYFRAQFDDGTTYIVMDAPPEKEDCQPFVHLAKYWQPQGVNVPKIYAEDLTQGFLLLSDFGDTPLQAVLNQDNASQWANVALQALTGLQSLWQIPDYSLPHFSADFAFQQCVESEHWFFSEHLQLPITASHKALFTLIYDLWAEAIAAQPLVAMHRDFHCNNLMVTSETKPALGILDFQDAMYGPLLHDVASLFLDRYPIWPEQVIRDSLKTYLQHMQHIGIVSSTTSKNEFKRWFDFTAMQRHFRIMGTFARLCHRDQKPHYLNFLPTFLNYVITASKPYPELTYFHALLVNDVAPRLESARQRATAQESML